MITKIFCEIDDFIKESENKSLIGEIIDGNSSNLSLSEIMTVLVMYYNSGNRTFKDYYTKVVQIRMKAEFPKLVSYNRFIELQESATIPLIQLLKKKIGSIFRNNIYRFNKNKCFS